MPLTKEEEKEVRRVLLSGMMNLDKLEPFFSKVEPELAAASSIDRACFEYDRDLRLTVLTVLVLPPAGVVMMTSGLWK